MTYIYIYIYISLVLLTLLRKKENALIIHTQLSDYQKTHRFISMPFFENFAPP